MPRSLQVWLGDIQIADIQRRGSRDLRCLYTSEALDRWGRNSPVMSCSLPLGSRPLRAEAFLRGVLPEGRALEALAARAEVAPSDTFGLLARYGRDIAGALIISEGTPQPKRFETRPYSEESLAEEIADLDSHPLGVHHDSELSIAGLQNKVLLVQLDGDGWGRPLHGRPSTHILKVDSASRPGLVIAEAQCLLLAKKLGLTTVTAELREVGAQWCLIVSRFDRAMEGHEVRRIHQEDLCQASGLGAKYESRGRGGPSFATAAHLLDAYAAAPIQELERLVSVATYTLAIGNADCHGKNVALLHDSPETVTLAPLYDTVPTIMWKSLRTDAAMAFDGRYSLENCDREDIVAEAKRWPVPERRAREVVEETLEALRDALEAGDVVSDSRLARTLRKRVRNLLAGGVPGPAAVAYSERPRPAA